MYYKLVDYFDVWGNENDGWQVMDACTIEDGIFIDENATDQEILDFLVTFGYLIGTQDVKLESYGVDAIDIIQESTGCPLGILVADA